MTRGRPSQFTINHPTHPEVGYRPSAPAPTLKDVDDFLDWSSHGGLQRLAMLVWELMIHVRQLEYERNRSEGRTR